MNKVLFVGTHDVYRSKFAAIYFNARCSAKNLNHKAFSVGFDISQKKKTISPSVLDHLGQMGIISEEDELRPSLLTEVYLQSCQKVICMDMEEHLTMMRKQFPIYVRQATYWHYPNIDVKSQRTTLPLIKKEVDHLIASLQLVEAS